LDSRIIRRDLIDHCKRCRENLVVVSA
jgi:hypothetical protein